MNAKQVNRTVTRTLREAAKAGSPQSRAYWEMRAGGLEKIANLLLGERPVTVSRHSFSLAEMLEAEEAEAAAEEAA